MEDDTGGDPLGGSLTAQGPQIGAATALDHVGMAVSDLDAALTFYATALGLVETHREVNEDQQVTEVMLATASEVASHDGSTHRDVPTALSDPAMTDTGMSDAGVMGGVASPAIPTQLQLLAPTSADSVVARFLGRSGPGIHHIAYRVGDLEAASQRLRGLGMRLLYAAGRAGAHGSLINFIHPTDAGGALIELVQPWGIAH